MAVTPGLFARLFSEAVDEAQSIRNYAKVLANRSQKENKEPLNPYEVLKEQDPAVAKRLDAVNDAVLQMRGAKTDKEVKKAQGLLQQISDNKPAVAAATTATAAAVAPDESEAAPSPVPVWRLIQAGLMDPKYANDATQIKRATTRYNKALKSSRAAREREAIAREGGYETVFQTEMLPDRRIISPESVVGSPLVAIRGDRSDIGLLSKVGGIPVDEIVEGGYKFSKKHEPFNYGWASSEDIARGAHNRLRIAADETGEIPVGVYNAMGMQSVDFSTPIASSMMNQIKNGPKLAKKDIQSFDREMRLSYPDWVGLESPNAYAQLMGQGDFPSIGKMRTAFTSIMGKRGYQERGFPSKQETVDAVTAEALREANYGDAGMTMYRPDVESDVIVKPGVHLSYDTMMPGKYIGGLEQQVPFEVMFPKTFERMSKETTKAGKPYTRDQSIVATNIRKDTYEQTDQEWLDGIMGWLERNADKVKTGGKGLLGAGTAASIVGSAQANQQPEMTPAQFMNSAGGFANASKLIREYDRQNNPDNLGSLVTGIKRGVYKGNAPVPAVLGLMGALGAPGANEIRDKLAESKIKGDDNQNQLLTLLGEIIGGSASMSPF